MGEAQPAEVVTAGEKVTPASVAALLRERAAGAVAFVYGLLVVGLVAGSTGGYKATTWGWAALATLWLAAVFLLVRDRIELRLLDLVYVGSLVAFTGWVALSNLWTPSVPSTMAEVQRNVAYVGVAAAGLLVVRRTAITQLLGGVATAIVALSAYGLSTRLLPDRFGDFDSTSFGYRLAAPITYWNSLGIFAVMGLFLALGFATRGRYLLTRAVAAATLPILTATLYFTFSRGSWYALGAGLLAAIAIDPRRLQLVAVSLTLLPWSALAIASAHTHHGLITIGSSVQQATIDGNSLTRILFALGGVSALTAVAVGIVERHVRVPSAARTIFAATLVLAIVLGAATVWAKEGSPTTLARRGWSAFHSAPTGKGSVGDVSARLLTLSSDGRIDLWRVAVHRFEKAPVIGDGGGTYWQAWARYRNVPSDSHEGHSLYLTTLAEVGLVGFALLVLALSAPLVAAFRARGRELVPLGLGAYVAWAAHAGIDWDWQLPGVTGAALLCGVAIVAASRGETAPRPRASWRFLGAAGLVAISIAALPALFSALALDKAYQRLGDGRSAAALKSARTADRWAPWASEPALLIGDILREEGNTGVAVADYRRALARDRSSWLLWAQLASVTHGEERAHALAEAHRLNPLVPS